MTQLFLSLLVCICILLGMGCGGTLHRTGQVELFYVDPEDQHLLRPDSVRYENQFRKITNRDRTYNPEFGDRVRLNTDVVTILVKSAHLDQLPQTLTGSRDIVVFAEVWENSAERSNERKLTAVVFAQEDQLVPGRLNFNEAIAYGPTLYKGHPLTIKFTIMLLQKRKGEKQGKVADVVSKAAESIPTYGVIASQAAAIMRDVLKAQPDIVVFEYEATLISDSPEGVLPTITRQTSTAPAGAISSDAVAEIMGTNSIENEILTMEEAANRLFAWGIDPELLDHALMQAKDLTLKNLLEDAHKLAVAEDAYLSRIPSDTSTGRQLRDEARTRLKEIELGIDEMKQKPRNASIINTAKAAADKVIAAQKPAASDKKTVRKNKLDDRHGWLHYGQYALLETESREVDEETSRPNKVGAGPSIKETSRPKHAGRQRFDPNEEYVHEGGWIQRKPKAAPTAGKGSSSPMAYQWQDRVRAKYVVFEVVPKQLKISDEVLLAASRAHARTLSDLQQNTDNLTSLATTIDNSLGTVKRSVIESKAQKEATSWLRSNGISTRADFTPTVKTNLTTHLTGRVKAWSTALKTGWDPNATDKEIVGVVTDVVNKIETSFLNLN